MLLLKALVGESHFVMAGSFDVALNDATTKYYNRN